MVSEGDDSADLAHWLQDVARRGAHVADPSQAELARHPLGSNEDVLGYLEQRTGRQLRSREAVDSYFKDLAADDARRIRVANRRRIVRESLFLGLLLAAYLHYYYWDVSLQIATLEQPRFFAPAMPHNHPHEGARQSG